MRFQPGQSGNPGGRPKKGGTLTDALREYADETDVEFKGAMISRKKALAQKVWQLALNGDLAALKYIYDRIDGLPIATTRIGSEEDNELRVLVKIERDNNRSDK